MKSRRSAATNLTGRTSVAPTLSDEHPRIIPKRLRVEYSHASEVRVFGIDKDVILARRDHRWHQQQTVPSRLGEIVTKTRKLRWSGRVAPIWRELADVEALFAQIIWNLSDCKDKIVWRVVLINVDVVLQHGQRLVF